MMNVHDTPFCWSFVPSIKNIWTRPEEIDIFSIRKYAPFEGQKTIEKLNTKVDKLGQILDVGEQAVLLRGPLVPVTPTRTGWPQNKFWEKKLLEWVYTVHTYVTRVR
jgi:hypothetical protein